MTESTHFRSQTHCREVRRQAVRSKKRKRWWQQSVGLDYLICIASTIFLLDLEEMCDAIVAPLLGKLHMF